MANGYLTQPQVPTADPFLIQVMHHPIEHFFISKMMKRWTLSYSFCMLFQARSGVAPFISILFSRHHYRSYRVYTIGLRRILFHLFFMESAHFVETDCRRVSAQHTQNPPFQYGNKTVFHPNSTSPPLFLSFLPISTQYRPGLFLFGFSCEIYWLKSIFVYSH